MSYNISTTALPTAGPRISGGSPLYRLGDRVRVNCTSDSSHPAPDLQWFINGKLVILFIFIDQEKYFFSKPIPNSTQLNSKQL